MVYALYLIMCLELFGWRDGGDAPAVPEAQAPEPVQKEIATVRKGPTSVPAEGLLEPDPLFHDGRDPGVPFLGCCTADSTEQDTPKGNRQRAREILVNPSPTHPLIPLLLGLS